MLTAACTSTAKPESTRSATSAAARDFLIEACRGDVAVTAVGRLANPALTETSGLVASRAHPGVLWAHNDSGDSARVFALQSDGTDLGAWSIPGVTPRDWEDIAIGPGPSTDGWSLYLGDIGDNQRARSSIQVVRIPEPDPRTRPSPGATLSTQPAQVFTLVYPDGPHDAEALLVDPDDGAVVVVTKEVVGPAAVYVAHLRSGSVSGTTALERAGDVSLGLIAPITGGDVSPNGRIVGLRSYGQVFLMGRERGATVAAALRSDDCSVTVDNEAQGEALALLDDSYITTSEGAAAPLHQTRAA